MEVIATAATAAGASLTLRYDFDGGDPVLRAGYPFHLRTEITYTLSAAPPSVGAGTGLPFPLKGSAFDVSH
eukprot:SAG11_NODE_5408_length_1570_cov_1.501020_2_plen_71_part_00